VFPPHHVSFYLVRQVHAVTEQLAFKCHSDWGIIKCMWMVYISGSDPEIPFQFQDNQPHEHLMQLTAASVLHADPRRLYYKVTQMSWWDGADHCWRSFRLCKNMTHSELFHLVQSGTFWWWDSRVTFIMLRQVWFCVTYRLCIKSDGLIVRQENETFSIFQHILLDIICNHFVVQLTH